MPDEVKEESSKTTEKRIKRRRYLRDKIYPHWQRAQKIQAAAGQKSINTPGFWRVRKETARTMQLIEEKGETDQMTGVLNRNGLIRRFEEEKERVKRILYEQNKGRGLKPDEAILIFFDANELKEVNDESGHVAGDAYIKALATLTAETLKPEDMFGRWGADEFIIYAPNTNFDEGRIIWERISQILQGHKNDEMNISQIWISGGMVRANPLNIDETIKKADQIMYVAKEAAKKNFRATGQKINTLRTEGDIAVPLNA